MALIDNQDISWKSYRLYIYRRFFKKQIESTLKSAQTAFSSNKFQILGR